MEIDIMKVIEEASDEIKELHKQKLVASIRVDGQLKEKDEEIQSLRSQLDAAREPDKGTNEKQPTSD